ncbi:MAG: permease-like cell division protein FtsX [Lachnospiraceae bacterium]|nr:permease-like cell division protein FtsX [Candidatus Darwinimomas equi]
MYSIGQAFKNICKNIRLSLASVATISACIFLFCLFFSVIVNLRNIVTNIETKVGITVFFDEDLSDSEVKTIGEEIKSRPEVKDIEFTSADDAWESFKKDYFEGREELAEGFAQDNPLKGSSSYSIWLNDVTKQDEFVQWLQGLNGVRQVNYSNQAGSMLTGLNNALLIVSLVLIGVLLAVAIFLIRNTVVISAEFRKSETAIMKLVGATNSMIRAPFIIEGVVLGFVGAAIPLAAIYFLYNYAVTYMQKNFTMLSDIFSFLPISEIFPVMAVTALLLGVGIGFFTSLFALNKHLRV